MSSSYKIVIIGLFFVLMVSFLFAQNPKPVIANNVNTAIESLKKDKDFVHASWGMYAVNAKTGKAVAEYNSKLSLVPASTLKTVTTAAALGILGSNFRYETKLEYDGYIDDITGVLYGNIYIKGSGDPSLGSEYFNDQKDSSLTDKWGAVLKRAGITRIEGAIIGDGSVFEDELVPSQWIWGDMGNYFGIGACGLSYMDNNYSLFFKTGKNEGDSTQITSMAPFIPAMEIHNYVKTGGSDDNSVIYGSPYTCSRYIMGTLPADKTSFEIKGALPDPVLFCAYSLQQSLRKYNVVVEQPASTIREMKQKGLSLNAKRKWIYTHYSPTLDKLVYYTNIKSNNSYAESLLKTVAVRSGKEGTEDKGIETVINYWKSKGLDLDGLNMMDGCGLARANLITPQIEANMLKTFIAEKDFQAFYNSLPVAGKSGSLASMCKGTKAENNLRAKSGYINKVRTYTGYVSNSKGELIVFSILFNNYTCSAGEAKSKIEKLLVLLAE